MIKIIKEGTKEIRECESCGCIFSFDKEDIELINKNNKFERYVRCPQCSFKFSYFYFENKIPYVNCSNCIFRKSMYREGTCKECAPENGFKNWEPMEDVEEESK